MSKEIKLNCEFCGASLEGQDQAFVSVESTADEVKVRKVDSAGFYDTRCEHCNTALDNLIMSILQCKTAKHKTFDDCCKDAQACVEQHL